MKRATVVFLLAAASVVIYLVAYGSTIPSFIAKCWKYASLFLPGLARILPTVISLILLYVALATLRRRRVTRARRDQVADVAEAGKPGSEQPTGEADKRPDWFPKTPEKLAQWEQGAWVIESRDKLYRMMHKAGKFDDPKPKNEDYRDAILEHVKWSINKRTIERIKLSRKNGWLKRKRPPRQV